MNGYPLNLLLEGRLCLVIGSDAEGERRAAALLEAGALVKLVGEEPPSPELRELAERGQLRLEQRALQETDFDDVWLVVQASVNRQLAQKVAEACRARRVFFCAIDQPEHSSFSHLALARAGALTLAIGTNGKAPALARRLREELERLLQESEAERHLDELATLRESTPEAERRDAMARAIQGVRFTGKLSFDEPLH